MEKNDSDWIINPEEQEIEQCNSFIITFLFLSRAVIYMEFMFRMEFLKQVLLNEAWFFAAHDHE